jgi:predicted Fe-S protein YdhL (DUF1289 family)
MKLIDLINRVCKDEMNESYPCPETLKRELDAWHLDIYDFDDRFKCYWIGRHYCTDTHVGIRAYYLDGKPVCASCQPARKSEETFEWISKEAANKVLKYMRELAKEKGQELEVSIMDPEQEWPEGYAISYATQVMDDWVMWEGKKYPVDKASTTRDAYIDKFIIIETEDGKRKVELSDCLFPWRIVPQ